MANQYRKEGNKLYFTFSFNQSIINSLKELDPKDRKFDPIGKQWVVQYSLLNQRKVKDIIDKYGFSLLNDGLEKESQENSVNDYLAKKSRLNLIKSYEEEIKKIEGKITPRTFQVTGINYQCSWPRMINGDDMGLGKSIMTLFSAEVMNRFPCLLVCPSGVKYQWMELWRAVNPDRTFSIIEAADKNKDWLTDVVIINYDILGKKSKYIDELGEEKWKAVVKYPEIQSRVWNYIVFDEIHYCFQYDTMISTDRGLLKIGDIVTNKIECKVKSFNLIDKNVCYSSINDYICTDLYERFVVINYGKSKLICTENHLIYTNNGWKKAIEISDRDFLFKVRKNFCEEKQVTEILLKGVFSRNKKLSNLLKRIFNIFHFRKKILLDVVLSNMEDGSKGDQGKDSFTGSASKSGKDPSSNVFREPSFSAKLFKKNEGQQSYADGRNQRKSSGYTKRKRFFKCLEWRKRWQRKTNRAAIKIIQQIDRFRNQCKIRTTYINNKPQTLKSTVTNKLQSRYRFIRFFDQYRNRWSLTQLRQATVFGFEKRIGIEFIGVESVEILKQSDYERYGLCNSRDSKVYCLGVDITNNFFANEVLVHNCKSYKSLRSKAAQLIANKIPNRHGLTGTLVENKPVDIVNPLMLIGVFNEIFGSWDNFTERYCDAKETRFGKDVSGASNTLELNRILLSTCYIHREKRDVLDDLPPIQTSVLNIEIDNKKAYKQAEDDFIDYLTKNYSAIEVDNARNAEYLVQRNHLRQLSLKGKSAGIIDWLEDFTENTREKALVVGNFTEVLLDLSIQFDAELINGDMDAKEKREAIKKWNRDKRKQFMFAGIKAVGTGTDGLQDNCSTLVILDLPDKPGTIDQLISRLERMGQKNPIFVYFLLNRETIDMRLWEAIGMKREITEAINKGKKVQMIDVDKLIMLSYLKRK